jgi:hypothetical protein
MVTASSRIFLPLSRLLFPLCGRSVRPMSRTILPQPASEVKEKVAGTRINIGDLHHYNRIGARRFVTRWKLKRGKYSNACVYSFNLSACIGTKRGSGLGYSIRGIATRFCRIRNPSTARCTNLLIGIPVAMLNALSAFAKSATRSHYVWIVCDGWCYSGRLSRL